ncbi:hypothetical protein VTN00DRAFT_8411 [Thermoascus crustaceus]|uniref:uncharacterized protein n=1 Tax=Thermoascus crustaceus TaxID=5088 RepID=UPI0037426CCC
MSTATEEAEAPAASPRPRIFITGATGYIGLVVTSHALSAGYTVHGLSCTPSGDAKLLSLGTGATPIRGDLTTLDVLRRESAAADIVIHLAYIHDWTMDYDEILRIDAAAVDALAEPLQGTGKPLVITSGSALAEPDLEGNETSEDAPITMNEFPPGVRVRAVRLPPYVYGRGGGTGFVVLLTQTALKIGESLYVDDGRVRTLDVHVDDVARLYLLVAERARKEGKEEAGEIFNSMASTTTTTRELTEAIGAVLWLPVRSVSRDEAEEKWGKFLATIPNYENRASNRQAVERLGWGPREVDLITDIREGSFVEVAERFEKG